MVLVGINMEMNLEEVEVKVPKCELLCKRELEDCRCGELEERAKKAEARCVELELEIQKRKGEYEVLEAKLKALEAEKLSIEDELKVLKARNGELEGRINHVEDENMVRGGGARELARVVDLTGENEEEDKVVLMIENSVLECEKKKAESEVEVWKKKFKELESWVLQLDKSRVLRGVEQPLNGKIEVVLGLPGADCSVVSVMKDISDTTKIKDGAHLGTSLDHLQTNEKVVDLGSTNNSPGKGNGGIPCYDTPHTPTTSTRGEKIGVHLESELKYGRRVRKYLAFEEDRSPSKKMAPSTPGGAKPASLGIIDICDSDDESDMASIQMASPDNHANANANGKVCISTGHALEGTVGSEKEITFEDSLKRTLSDQSYEETGDACKDTSPFVSTPKRKRASNIVPSDTESDDDKVPICKLKRMHLQEIIPNQASYDSKSSSMTATPPGDDSIAAILTPSRRRLVKLRQCEGKCGEEKTSSSKITETKYHQRIPTTKDVEDDESDEGGSQSEGESLGGFIVGDSDVSDSDDISSESQDISDCNENFGEILSRLRRNKEQKSKWEFEADMLAEFGKDPELCMKAVCVLYRQQTSEEKISKDTFYHNHRGFSKFDALRGTTVAEFLTDRDPQGDLMKSVKELQEYDPKAVELCRTLATHYSKQLFEIYNNKEDPFFRPS